MRESKGRVRLAAVQLMALLLGLVVVANTLRGEDSPARKELRAAYQKAESLKKEGDLREAARHYERAVQLASTVFGEQSKERASLLNKLANLYREMGQYDRAEPLYQRSLEIREEKLGAHHPDVAQSLNNLAYLYQAMGQYDRAEPLYQRSLQIWEDKLGAHHLRVALSLNNLANLYQLMGQLAKAEPLYQRSLEIREEQLGAHHPDVATCLTSLANLYQNMGQYARAEPMYQRSLEIQEGKLGAHHPDVALSLNSLANLYREMGQYARAVPLYQRSLQIREEKRGANHPDVAQSLNNLALLYQVMGQYAKAEPLYKRSLKIWEEKLGASHPRVALSLNNLALLYREMGQYDRAEPLYQRSLEIREEKLGAHHPDVAQSLNNLAYLYQVMGKYARAEEMNQRSLKIREEKLGANHPDVAQSLNNLANLYQTMGQYARAEPLYQRSLKIWEDRLGADHPRVARGRKHLAELKAAQGEWRQAAEALDRSRRIVRRHVHAVLPILSEADQLTFLKNTAEKDFHLALSLGWQQRSDGLLATLSAGWLLNGKAVAQECLAQRALLARQASNPRLAALTQKLLQLRTQRAHLTEVTPSADQKDAHRQQLAQLAAEEHDLERKLAQAGGQPQRPEPWVALDDVRKAIPADAIFIDIARFKVYRFEAKGRERRWQPARYAAWVIPPAGQGDVQLVDLGEAGRIETVVQEIRQALEHAPSTIEEKGEPDSQKALQKPLDELATLVLKPLQPHIGKQKQWLLSPDGALWLVPWAALPLGDGSFALEKHSLRYLVSGRDVVQSEASGKGRAGAAQVFADPDFDLAPSQTAASSRGRSAARIDLSGLTLRGRIDDWNVTFELRADGRFFIRDAAEGNVAGEGTWKQQGNRVLLQTRVARFEGTVQGQTLSGTRHRQQDDGRTSEDRWSARLPADRVAAADLVRAMAVVTSSQLDLPAVARLPGTAQEAARVAPRLEVLSGSKPLLYTRGQASEGQVKAVERPRLLMLSTHGFFLPEQPVEHREELALAEPAAGRAAVGRDSSGQLLESPLRRCGLLLAGCNQRQKAHGGEEDGVLLGEEIVGLDLRGTELVVLSACETGLGQVRNGEGVAGLRQAFQLAGAQSVLATLWQIPDRETAQLMSSFFEELSQGKDRADALRQAQLKLIERRQQRYGAAHPFYWAAFTLTGQ